MESAAYRRSMGRFATGVALLAVGRSDRVRAITVNSVTSVSLQPCVVSVCVRNESAMLGFLDSEPSFSLSVLGSEQEALSRHYAGQRAAEEPRCWVDEDGVPVVRDALAAFVCDRQSAVKVGDHTVVFGVVRRIRERDDAPEPLVFFGGGYHRIPARSAAPAR